MSGSRKRLSNAPCTESAGFPAGTALEFQSGKSADSLLHSEEFVLKSRSLQTTLFPAMSQHASLKKSSSIGAKRSVLKRYERVKLLQKRGKWEEGRSPLGLPKTTPES